MCLLYGFRLFFRGVSHVSFNVRNSCVLRSLFPFSRTISLRHAIFLRCQEACSRCQQVSSLCQSIFLPCRVTLSPCQRSSCRVVHYHSPCQHILLAVSGHPLAVSLNPHSINAPEVIFTPLRQSLIPWGRSLTSLSSPLIPSGHTLTFRSIHQSAEQSLFGHDYCTFR